MSQKQEKQYHMQQRSSKDQTYFLQLLNQTSFERRWPLGRRR